MVGGCFVEAAVGAAADEDEVGDVVNFSIGLLPFEDCFGEDVVELEVVLASAVVEGDDEVACPVTSILSAECQEHGFEERTSLVAPLKLTGGDVESADLLAEAGE